MCLRLYGTSGIIYILHQYSTKILLLKNYLSPISFEIKFEVDILEILDIQVLVFSFLLLGSVWFTDLETKRGYMHMLLAFQKIHALHFT